MKIFLLLPFLALTLQGCVVEPIGYDYGRDDYYYRHGYDRHDEGRREEYRGRYDRDDRRW